MKITIVQGAFLPVPPLLGGAVEKVWQTLGREFARKGHEVIHISRSYANLPSEEIIDGVKHRRVSGFSTPNSIVLLKCYDLLYSLKVKKILPQADILVTNTFWLPVLLRNQNKGRQYVHVQRYPRHQMFLYRKAARIQTVSHVIADAIQKQNPELTSKIKIIPNPLPSDFYLNDTITLKNNDEIIFLYVGRIHPEKGLDLLLNAYMKFCNESSIPVRLRIIGPHLTSQGGGGEAYLSHLKKMFIQNYPIEWLGPIFDSEKLQIHYAQGSFLIYPTIADKGEASPLTPIEAMAKGCIPILSNLDCFNDYLQPGYNGFSFDLQNGDPVNNLASVLMKVTKSPDSLDDMRKACLDTASNFLPTIIAEQYLRDFEMLLKS